MKRLLGKASSTTSATASNPATSPDPIKSGASRHSVHGNHVGTAWLTTCSAPATQAPASTRRWEASVELSSRVCLWVCARG